MLGEKISDLSLYGWGQQRARRLPRNFGELMVKAWLTQLETLSLDTAYRSFGGELEASSTPRCAAFSDSRRHRLPAIALNHGGPAVCGVERQLQSVCAGHTDHWSLASPLTVP